MSHICDGCGKSFKSARGMQSHRTQKKCGRKKPIDPSNPFFKFLRRKSSPLPVKSIEMQPLSKPSKKKLTFTTEDLQITEEIIPENADQRSPEFRTTIRAHFDSLKTKFKSLTCIDYARANPKYFAADGRTFQRWCTPQRRKQDLEAIKIKKEKENAPKSDEKPYRRGYKDRAQGKRHRFANHEKYSFLMQWDEEKN